MFCKNCGKEVKDNIIFCPHCGAVVEQKLPNQKSTDDLKKPNVNDKKPLEKIIILAVGVFIIIAIVMGIKSCSNNSPKTAAPDNIETTTTTSTEAEASIVGTWEADGVSVSFSESGVMRLEGKGISLGGDAFQYEVKDSQTLYLTTKDAPMGINLEYSLSGDTLYIKLEDEALAMSRKK